MARGGEERRVAGRAAPHLEEMMKLERITKIERQVEVLTRQMAVMQKQQEHHQYPNRREAEEDADEEDMFDVFTGSVVGSQLAAYQSHDSRWESRLKVEIPDLNGSSPPDGLICDVEEVLELKRIQRDPTMGSEPLFSTSAKVDGVVIDWELPPIYDTYPDDEVFFHLDYIDLTGSEDSDEVSVSIDLFHFITDSYKKTFWHTENLEKTYKRKFSGGIFLNIGGEAIAGNLGSVSSTTFEDAFVQWSMPTGIGWLISQRVGHIQFTLESESVTKVRLVFILEIMVTIWIAHLIATLRKSLVDIILKVNEKYEGNILGLRDHSYKHCDMRGEDLFVDQDCEREQNGQATFKNVLEIVCSLFGDTTYNILEDTCPLYMLKVKECFRRNNNTNVCRLQGSSGGNFVKTFTDVNFRSSIFHTQPELVLVFNSKDMGEVLLKYLSITDFATSNGYTPMVVALAGRHHPDPLYLLHAMKFYITGQQRRKEAVISDVPLNITSCPLYFKISKANFVFDRGKKKEASKMDFVIDLLYGFSDSLDASNIFKGLLMYLNSTNGVTTPRSLSAFDREDLIKQPKTCSINVLVMSIKILVFGFIPAGWLAEFFLNQFARPLVSYMSANEVREGNVPTKHKMVVTISTSTWGNRSNFEGFITFLSPYPEVFQRARGGDELFVNIKSSQVNVFDRTINQINEKYTTEANGNRWYKSVHGKHKRKLLLVCRGFSTSLLNN